MGSITNLLKELTNVEGVQAAVVIARDGFVIEGRTRDGELDTEVVGATVSTGLRSAEAMGRELGIGGMTQGMTEYDKGVIVVSSLGPEAILAVLVSHGANLGNVRYQVKRKTPLIERAI